MPVSDIDLVRQMLSVTIEKDWNILQLDVKVTFLHVPLPEFKHIWTRLTKFKGSKLADKQITKLVESLLGFSQALKLGNQLISDGLKNTGFTKLSCNDCLFIGRKKDPPSTWWRYVDDILVFGEQDNVEETKKRLINLFDV